MNFPRFVAYRLVSAEQKSFTRTIIRIATIAIAISVCVMICTTALVRGFKYEISQKVYGLWGHINITDIRADNSYEALPIDVDSALIKSLMDIGQVEVNYGTQGNRAVASHRGVRHLQSVAHIPSILTSQGSMEGIVLKGVGTDFDWSTMEKYVVDGSLPDVSGARASNELLLSEYTANRLLLVVGDKVIIHFLRNERQVQRRFEVVGIYRTGLEDYDNKFAVAPIGVVQEFLGWNSNQVGAYEIFVEDLDDVILINDYIYLEELPSNLYSQSIRSRFPNIFEWLELQDVNQLVILGLTLVVAIINMISMLLILILERTRMIGVLKALGGKTRQIQAIFLHHASVLILRGMIIGNVVGIGLCLLQKHFKLIKLNEADYYVSYAPVDLSLLPILAVNGAALAVIMLFLLVPSALISRIDPVKTIQFG